MQQGGYIKLYRKIREHWVWSNAEYLKWWLDLLLLANHQPNKMLINGKFTIVETGEHLTSEVKLSERWYVDRKTVRKFLGLLEEDKMITIKKSRQNGTTVKVLNYKGYQAFFSADKDNGMDNKMDNKMDNGVDIKRDIKMDINKNLRTKEVITPLPPSKGEEDLKNIRASYVFSDSLGSAVDNWIKYKKEKRQIYKPVGFKSLLSQIESKALTYGSNTVVDLINDSMASNYQGITWDKLKNNTQGNKSNNTKPERKNRFANFKQHERDYDEIERLEAEMLINSTKELKGVKSGQFNTN